VGPPLTVMYWLTQRPGLRPFELAEVTTLASCGGPGLRRDGRLRRSLSAVAELLLKAVLTSHRTGRRTLRWAYLHRLRELAHHCGHCDILRE
jgi:hypothetical protein